MPPTGQKTKYLQFTTDLLSRRDSFGASNEAECCSFIGNKLIKLGLGYFF